MVRIFHCGDDWDDQREEGGGVGAGTGRAQPASPVCGGGGGGVRQAALQPHHLLVTQSGTYHIVQEHRGKVGDPFVKLKYSTL